MEAGKSGLLSFGLGLPDTFRGDIDMATREEIQNRIDIMTAWLGGADVQFLGCTINTKTWIDLDAGGSPSFNFTNNKYRIKPLEPDYIDWSHVNAKYRFMARDRCGDVYLYENEPSDGSSDWMACGEFIPASNFSSLIIGKLPWKESKIVRPEGV